MLQNVTFEHFRALLGSTCTLQLEDGSGLPATITAVEEKPQARLSKGHRQPFNVSLNSLHPSAFVDGLCAVELPETGRLEGIYVSRVPPLGRDASLAYYAICFN
jgi:hypothetical protein